MNTDRLIHELAQRGDAVTITTRPSVRFGEWTAVTLLWIVCLAPVLGLRPDAARVVGRPAFELEFAAMLSLALVSVWAAFLLSVPDRTRRWLVLLPMVALASWAVIVASFAASASGFDAGAGVRCVRNLLAVGLPPVGLLHAMLRRAAPLRTRTVGALAALGAGAAACLATRFICHIDDGVHVLVWHFLPVVLLSGAGAMLGQWLARWNTTIVIHRGDAAPLQS